MNGESAGTDGDVGGSAAIAAGDSGVTITIGVFRFEGNAMAQTVYNVRHLDLDARRRLCERAKDLWAESALLKKRFRHELNYLFFRVRRRIP